MTLPAQLITLVTGQPPLSVTGLRGETPPVPVGGYGGWTLVARPRRKALTRWAGIEPFQMQLSMIFDGVRGNVSVERQCSTLERMAQPQSKRHAPPIVRIAGVVPHPEIAYVIGDTGGGSGLAWDANPIYSASGYRIRQQVTVTLLEYVADDRVAEKGAAARARASAAAAAASAAAAAGGTPATTKSYVVKRGDTLTSIAAARLGSAARWTEIAQLNGLTDPYTLAVGQTLRLP